MSDEPMLVSERWLTNADRRLRELSAPKTSKRKQGLFYLVRPFWLASPWTKNDDGEWTAKARPIVKDSGTVDVNARVDVFAPIQFDVSRPEITGYGRFWAVFRGGRWEYVCGYSGRSESQYYDVEQSEGRIIQSVEYGTAITEIVVECDVPKLEAVEVCGVRIYHSSPNSNVYEVDIFDTRFPLTLPTVSITTASGVRKIQCAKYAIPSNYSPNTVHDPGNVTTCYSSLTELETKGELLVFEEEE